MRKLILFSTLLFCNSELFAQVTTPLNFGVTGDFVGWNTTMGIPLDIVHENTQPINFHTTGIYGTSSSFRDNLRMQIFERNISAPNSSIHNVGRVGIMEDNSTAQWGTPIAPNVPVSLLHLGHGWTPGSGGHREWMDVGTYCLGWTDFIYTGVKLQSGGGESRPWNDRMDAIIGWGDNADVNADNLNDLRFVFTVAKGTSGSGDAGTEEGLEVMRMSYNGYCGIGSFRHPTNQTAPERPARRLEVLDRGDHDGRSLPQLRLTFEPDNDVFGGTTPRWTDFETTTNGDLLINPRSKESMRRVGINISNTPQATLDVRGVTAGNLPQLRLTHGPVVGAGTGIWADFHVTTTGNLYIHPTNTGVNTNVGIQTSTPTNTLEIQNGTAGQSGLTFTNLTSATATSFTNGKVLTVDNTGKVVLAIDDVGTGGGSSGFCSGITTDYLLKYNAGVSCQSGIYENPSTGFVGIGTAYPAARLEAILNTSSGGLVGGRFEVTNSSTSTSSATIGLRTRVQSSATSSAAAIYGVDSWVTSSSNQSVVGGLFSVDGTGTTHHAVSASSLGTGTNYAVNAGATSASAIDNFAVYGRAENGSGDNRGVWARATGTTGTSNWGLYAQGSAWNPACTTSCSNGAAYFNGDVNKTAYDNFASDAKFKQNINAITNSRMLLRQLTPKSYEFNHQYPQINFPGGIQYGLIAQELEQVIPDLVHNTVHPAEKDSAGNIIFPSVDYKSVNYVGLIPLLIDAVNDAHKRIDSLVNAINGTPRPVGNDNEIQERVVLSSIKAIQLHQNDPNPFSESTVIRFEIPETISSARIIFTDMKGDILKTATIESRGAGSLEVFASDLSSGLYNYTLVCDGKVIDSKKMVKQ